MTHRYSTTLQVRGPVGTLLATTTHHPPRITHRHSTPLLARSWRCLASSSRARRAARAYTAPPRRSTSSPRCPHAPRCSSCPGRAESAPDPRAMAPSASGLAAAHATHPPLHLLTAALPPGPERSASAAWMPRRGEERRGEVEAAHTMACALLPRPKVACATACLLSVWPCPPGVALLPRLSCRRRANRADLLALPPPRCRRRASTAQVPGWPRADHPILPPPHASSSPPQWPARLPRVAFWAREKGLRREET